MTKQLQIIGRAERVAFPELELAAVPARIDTGAKTSSIWASRVKEHDGQLEFVFFNKQSQYYTGKIERTAAYEQRVVTSSNGGTEARFALRLLVVVDGRKIRASFTLANRHAQVYPVLIGRNVLRGKFVVDVKQGQPHLDAERARRIERRASVLPDAKTKRRSNA